MVVIDTNIFLEFLLGQEKAEDCLSALSQITENSEDAVITSFTLHSIEVIMLRKKLESQLGDFLEALSALQNLAVYNASVAEDRTILKLSASYRLDFDDAVQYYVAKKLKAKLLTMDRHFRGLPGIRVISP